MNYCPRIKTLISSWDFKAGYLAVARLRCRQWDCPYCSVKNGDMWRAHLLHMLCEVIPSQERHTYREYAARRDSSTARNRQCREYVGKVFVNVLFVSRRLSFVGYRAIDNRCQKYRDI